MSWDDLYCEYFRNIDYYFCECICDAVEMDERFADALYRVNSAGDADGVYNVIASRILDDTADLADEVLGDKAESIITANREHIDKVVSKHYHGRGDFFDEGDYRYYNKTLAKWLAEDILEHHMSGDWSDFRKYLDDVLWEYAPFDLRIKWVEEMDNMTESIRKPVKRYIRENAKFDYDKAIEQKLYAVIDDAIQDDPRCSDAFYDCVISNDRDTVEDILLDLEGEVMGRFHESEEELKRHVQENPEYLSYAIEEQGYDEDDFYKERRNNDPYIQDEMIKHEAYYNVTNKLYDEDWEEFKQYLRSRFNLSQRLGSSLIYGQKNEGYKNRSRRRINESNDNTTDIRELDELDRTFSEGVNALKTIENLLNGYMKNGQIKNDPKLLNGIKTTLRSAESINDRLISYLGAEDYKRNLWFK